MKNLEKSSFLLEDWTASWCLQPIVQLDAFDMQCSARHFRHRPSARNHEAHLPPVGNGDVQPRPCLHPLPQMACLRAKRQMSEPLKVDVGSQMPRWTNRASEGRMLCAKLAEPELSWHFGSSSHDRTVHETTRNDEMVVTLFDSWDRVHSLLCLICSVVFETFENPTVQFSRKVSIFWRKIATAKKGLPVTPQPFGTGKWTSTSDSMFHKNLCWLRTSIVRYSKLTNSIKLHYCNLF